MKKICALLVCAGALFACTKTTQEAAKLEVNKTAIAVDAASNIAEVGITANIAWTAAIEGSVNWATLSGASGNGNGTLKVAVTKNESYDARELTITVKGESISRSIKLTQAEAGGLVVTTDEVEVNYEEQSIEIPVSSNVSYTATADVDWVSVGEPTKGLSDSKVPVTVEKNSGREARTAKVTLSGEGLSAVVEIVQGAFEPEFDLEDEYGVGCWGTLSVPVEGIVYTFTAVTNMDFYANSPDADWIGIAKEGNVVTVTIGENTGAARADYIYMGCSSGDVDYPDYGAMIRVEQSANAMAEEIWSVDFNWNIFPNGTRVSMATAGDYVALYSPGFVAPGIHLMKKESGEEVSILDCPVANITGITNDDAGHIVVTAGGNYPISEETWSLIVEQQIPLTVYVMSEEDFLAGNYGDPILTYYDGFYGYGLDNARVCGDAKGDALLTMTSGAAGGGTYTVAWEIRGGATTSDPTKYAVAPTAGGDLWDSFHAVSIGMGPSVSDPFYFAGYVGDYNVQYNAALADDGWSVAFTTGYTWEGAVNSANIFSYNGKKYMAIIGMNYFAFADWDSDGVVDLQPSTLWVLDMSDAAHPDAVIAKEYYANAENWQYGSNTDVRIVEEDGQLVAYVVDVATSTYRKFGLIL